jgi:hypothetical protein
LLCRAAWRAAFPQNGHPIPALGIAQTRQNRVLGGWNALGRWGLPRPGAFLAPSRAAAGFHQSRMEDHMPRTITVHDIEAQLAQAARVRATAPRCTAEQLTQARLTWAWLTLVDPQSGKLLEARASGASWAAVARHAGLSYHSAVRMHGVAPATIAGKLNAALTG